VDEMKEFLPKRQIHGLINMNELKLYRDYLKKQHLKDFANRDAAAVGVAGVGMESIQNMYIGDVISAYIHNIRDDGRVDVGLRPGGIKRVHQTRDMILEKLKSAENKTIPIGDRSDPSAIAKFFPGVSKLQFKTAVGALFKEGLITPSKLSIVLNPKPSYPSSSSFKAAAANNVRAKNNQVHKDQFALVDEKGEFISSLLNDPPSENNESHESNEPVLKAKMIRNYLADKD
jgi:hypothetical protein